MTTYYLSSMESHVFEQVRTCTIIKRMAFDSGNECALVKLEPAVIVQTWALVPDEEYFVIAGRHQGFDLFPITTFPCFVHIARILNRDILSKDTISVSELQNIAWGELYRTAQDAKDRVIDPT